MKYKSKKGQLPFIEVNGEEIADSAIIIKQLGEKFNTDLDAGLSAEQKLVAHSNISMIENHFACQCFPVELEHGGRGAYTEQSFSAGSSRLRHACCADLPSSCVRSVMPLKCAGNRQHEYWLNILRVRLEEPDDHEQLGRVLAGAVELPELVCVRPNTARIPRAS
ncbi:Thioredoxin-like fold [Trinorchestia longiramus]|nr:Thioredoxin-like fold [Trinorchestia longiramus]